MFYLYRNNSLISSSVILQVRAQSLVKFVFTGSTQRWSSSFHPLEMQAFSCLGSWGDDSFCPISGKVCKEGNIAVASCSGKLHLPTFRLEVLMPILEVQAIWGHSVTAACWAAGNGCWNWWCKGVYFCCRGKNRWSNLVVHMCVE